ncbi:MAG: WYL domain-containing protein [Lachnospiraceae bacterium]|nr:WYL domain-containing protein [Lachnospiraceae bacterium]
MKVKNNAYVEAVELLSRIAFLLMNRDSEVLYIDRGLSITEVSELLDIPIPLVRRAMVELSSFNERGDKGGLRLYAIEDDEEAFQEMEDMLALYKDKRERAFNSGKLDDKKFYTVLDGYNDAYAMLTAKEYNILRKFLKEKYMSDNILHMDSEDFYKVIPSYTDDAENVISIQRELISAIKCNQDVDITYAGRDKNGKFTIKPLKLIRYSMYGVSYVVTVQDGEIIPYRVDQIKGVTVNSRSNIQIDDMAPMDKLPYVWGMDTRSGEADVVLKVYNHNYGKVIDKVRRDIGYYVQCAGYTVEELPSGDIIVRGHVVGKGAFLNWVRTYGASMVILEPTAWGQDIIGSALRRLKNYK